MRPSVREKRNYFLANQTARLRDFVSSFVLHVIQFTVSGEKMEEENSRTFQFDEFDSDRTFGEKISF